MLIKSATSRAVVDIYGIGGDEEWALGHARADEQ